MSRNSKAVTAQLPATVAEGKAAVVRNLESLVSLFESDREALASSLKSIVERSAGQELQAADTPLNRPSFVLSGWVCRTISLPDGRRQILDFYIPGELVAYSSRRSARAKASYLCLTDVTCVNVSELIERTHNQRLQYPGLTTAWPAIEDRIEASLLHQIVRNGQMLAHERILHLLSDLETRHRRSGLVEVDRLVMPLTQEILADALGLSAIHVNRVLQQLRREQIIRTFLGRIEIVSHRLLEQALQVGQ